MRNIFEVWNNICTALCRANPLLSVKMAPNLHDFEAKDKQLSGYYGQNKARAWIQFAGKVFTSLIQHQQGL